MSYAFSAFAKDMLYIAYCSSSFKNHITDECKAAPAWPAWGRAGCVRGHRMATFSVSNELQSSYPEPSILSIATPPEVPTLSFPDTVPPVGRAACRKKLKCQLYLTHSLTLPPCVSVVVASPETDIPGATRRHYAHRPPLVR